jgi:hypothetical protein
MSNLKSNKTLFLLKHILEIVWLIVALLALGIAIRETISYGFTKNMLYYAFSAVGFFFYFSRRKQRKRAE